MRWPGCLKPQRGPADLAVLLLGFMMPISFFASPLPQRSLHALFLLFIGIVFYFILANGRWKAIYWDWIAWFIVLLGAAIGAIGILGILFPRIPRVLGLGTLVGFLRWMAAGLNPNVVAGTIVPILPIGIARTLGALGEGRILRWICRIVGALSTMIMLAAVVLSGSRGAYMGAVFGLLLWAALCWKMIGRQLILLLGSVGVAAGSLLGWDMVVQTVVASAHKQGLSGREEVWSRAIYLISDFPLTGIGMDCFEPVVAHVYPMFIIADGTASHAHSLFLQVAVDLGLPGLVAYLAIIGLSLFVSLSAWHTFSREGKRDMALLSAACFVAIASISLHGFFDSAVWGNSGAFVTWVVMGICVGVYRVSMEED